jgi:hypothetical protein
MLCLFGENFEMWLLFQLDHSLLAGEEIQLVASKVWHCLLDIIYIAKNKKEYFQVRSNGYE